MGVLGSQLPLGFTMPSPQLDGVTPSAGQVVQGFIMSLNGVVILKDG